MAIASLATGIASSAPSDTSTPSPSTPSSQSQQPSSSTAGTKTTSPSTTPSTPLSTSLSPSSSPIPSTTSHPQPPPQGGDGHDSRSPGGHDGDYHPDRNHPPVPVYVQVDVTVKIGDQVVTQVTIYQVKEIPSIYVVVDVNGRQHQYVKVIVILEYGNAKHWCDGYYDESQVFHPIAVYPPNVQTPAAAVATPETAKTLPSEAIVTGVDPDAASWWTDNRAWVILAVAAIVFLGAGGTWLVFRRRTVS